MFEHTTLNYRMAQLIFESSFSFFISSFRIEIYPIFVSCALHLVGVHHTIHYFLCLAKKHQGQLEHLDILVV